MNDVFCFGELLLRMSPVLDGEWLRQASMPVYIGGAELNVATALARWKLPVKYFTALPDNYLSAEIVRELCSRNIDPSAIHFSGQRIGIYFLPQGADLKHAAVIYDRAHASFAELQPGMIDWDGVLENVSWFHFSAISPALGENVAEVCREALQCASKKKITISVDLNYRSQLWRHIARPEKIMEPLVHYCDVVMGNIWSANALLGTPVDMGIHDKGKRSDYLDHAARTASAIRERFPKSTAVANTFRFDRQDGSILYYSSLFQDHQQYDSEEFVANGIVDRVGSGDCFMAGLIYGLYQRHSPLRTINFATSAAFGKFYEQGDTTRQDIETIQSRLKTNG